MHQGIIRYRSLSADQLLHDLNWCVNSQNLFIEEPPGCKGELMSALVGDGYKNSFKKWFESLSRNPESLQLFFANDEQLILGKYFERLLLFYFSHFEQYKVLYSGMQLFDRERTVGELDFIIKDEDTKEIIHIEAAVKYYMGYKNTSKHSMWIGPNGMDTLAKKMEKFDQQLAHSELDDVKKLVRVDRKQILLKGYFYKHLSASSSPYFYNPAVEECGWMYQNEMKEFIEGDVFYSIIPKNKWLGFFLDNTLKVYQGSELIVQVYKQLEMIGKGIMIVKIDTSEMLILEKMIVVPQRWPRL